MDFLFSLVGQDQDTITEAIKELAENADKVKLQEKEIEKLRSWTRGGKTRNLSCKEESRSKVWCYWRFGTWSWSYWKEIERKGWYSNVSEKCYEEQRQNDKWPQWVERGKWGEMFQVGAEAEGRNEGEKWVSEFGRGGQYFKRGN